MFCKKLGGNTAFYIRKMGTPRSPSGCTHKSNMISERTFSDIWPLYWLDEDMAWLMEYIEFENRLQLYLESLEN